MTQLDSNKKIENTTPSQDQIQEKDDCAPKNRQKDWWRYLVEITAVIGTILKVLEFLGIEL